MYDRCKQCGGELNTAGECVECHNATFIEDRLVEQARKNIYNRCSLNSFVARDMVDGWLEKCGDKIDYYPKYEYTVQGKSAIGFHGEYLVNILNDYGKDGWELVPIEIKDWLIFKRERYE